LLEYRKVFTARREDALLPYGPPSIVHCALYELDPFDEIFLTDPLNRSDSAIHMIESGDDWISLTA